MSLPPRTRAPWMIPRRHFFPTGDYSQIMNQTFISKEDPVVEKTTKIAKEKFEKEIKHYDINDLFEMEEIMKEFSKEEDV